MQLRKLSVVLLALLLAAMVMIPMVSAAGTCQSTGINDREKITNSLPERTIDLREEFNLEKSIENKNAAPIESYESSKDLSDKIMKEAKLSDDVKNVIGLYDFGNSQMLLITRGDKILEAFYDGKAVKTYLLTPELLGDRIHTIPSQKIASPEADDGEYTIETSLQTTLRSIELVYPEEDSLVPDAIRPASSQLVTVSRTDVYRNGLGDTIAQLITRADFYVNQGSSIIAISNDSNYWINPLQPGWVFCSYNYQTPGVGTYLGKLENQFKFGQLNLRCEMDLWISLNANLVVGEGGSTNQWISIYPDGCR